MSIIMQILQGIVSSLLSLISIAVMISVLVLALSPILLLVGLLKKDPIKKKEFFTFFKKALLFAALSLLVGTGLCVIGFTLGR